MGESNIGRGAGSTVTVLKTSFEVETKIEAIYSGGTVCLSKDGSLVYCTCSERINIVQTKTGIASTSLCEDEDEISCFALAPDQKCLVSAGKSLLLRQWDLASNKVSRKWKSLHIGPVLSMVFDNTSTLLATGSSDSTIKIWDVIKQYCTHNLKGSQGIINLLSFHPDDTKLQLLSAAGDNKIRMWDLKSSKCAATFEGHFSAVTSMSFTENTKHMISTGRDKVMIFWDLDLRSQIKTIPIFEGIEGAVVLPKSQSVQCVPNSDKECVVIGGDKGILQIRSFPDGKSLQSKPLWSVKDSNQSNIQPSIISLLYSQTTQQIVVVTYDHNIIFYEASSLTNQKQLVGNYDEILDIKFMGQKEELIAIATNSEQIKVLNRNDSNCHVLAGHSGTVLALDVSHDGQYIASCSKDNSIRLWKVIDNDMMSFECVAIGQGHTHAVGAISWPKLKSSFVVSASQDLTIKAWDIPATFREDECTSLIVKWTEKAHDKDVHSIAVSPNDKLLATASQDRTAKIWQASSGTLLANLRGHKRGVWCVAFSPVDQCVATSSGDGTIRIWTLSDYTCVKTFEEHTNSVLRVNFLSSGMQLVSSGSDGLIKLWTIRTNECVETLDSHSDKVWALAVSKREDAMVSGGSDALLNIWKDVTEEKKQALDNEREKILLQEQELSNLLQQKKFALAVRLALTLEQPYRVLCIFKDMLKEVDGRKQIEETLTPLRQDQLDVLLRFVCDWNTNARHSLVTQTVLSILLKIKTTEDLQKFDQIKERIESLLPYTERHFERLNRLLRQSTFIDYTLQCIKPTTSSNHVRSIKQSTETMSKSDDEEHVTLHLQDKMETVLISNDHMPPTPTSDVELTKDEDLDEIKEAPKISAKKRKSTAKLASKDIILENEEIGPKDKITEATKSVKKLKSTSKLARDDTTFVSEEIDAKYPTKEATKVSTKKRKSKLVDATNTSSTNEEVELKPKTKSKKGLSGISPKNRRRSVRISTRHMKDAIDD